jgi:hypothetical protein
MPARVGRPRDKAKIEVGVLIEGHDVPFHWTVPAGDSVGVVSYVEHLVASPVLACTWGQVTTGLQEHLVVPDACVDLIWSGERLSIAGHDTTARVVTLAPGSRLVGVRLRPGAAGAVLGMPASELRDMSPDAADVLGRDEAAALLDELAAGSDPHALLRRAMGLRGVAEPDPLVRAAVIALGRPHARVTEVARELGVSGRQLQRLVCDAVGYGPKMPARVLRFRRLQALAPPPLAEPVRFLKDRTPTAA